MGKPRAPDISGSGFDRPLARQIDNIRQRLNALDGASVDNPATTAQIDALQTQLTALAKQVKTAAAAPAASPTTAAAPLYASTAINAFTPVYQSAPTQVTPTDSSTIATADPVAGIAKSSAASGDQIQVAGNGEVITNPAWTWTPNAPVYVGPTGTLVQTPPDTGYVLEIGVALSATAVRVQARQPVIVTALAGAQNTLALVNGVLTRINLDEAAQDAAGAALAAGVNTGITVVYDDANNRYNLTNTGVLSFNGRTGAVTPQQADYDAYFLTPAEGNAAYQPLDPDLSALAALATSADTVPYFTGFSTAALATLTAYGRSLVAAVDAAAAQTVLGLGTMAVQNANAVAITGGAISGATTYQPVVTYTDLSGSVYPQYNSVTFSPASASSASVTGMQVITRAQGTSSAMSGTLSGISAQVWQNSSGTIANLIGVDSIGIVIPAAPGVVTNLAAFRARSPSLQGPPPANSITNAYGILIQSVANSTYITNPYGVYQAGASDYNIFAGISLFGTTANSFDDGSGKLQVQGGARVYSTTDGLVAGLTPSTASGLTLHHSLANVGAGGTLQFAAAGASSATPKTFAALKGFYQNGTGNGIGDLVVSLRALTTDTALTEAARFKSRGALLVGTATDDTTSTLLVVDPTPSSTRSPITAQADFAGVINAMVGKNADTTGTTSVCAMTAANSTASASLGITCTGYTGTSFGPAANGGFVRSSAATTGGLSMIVGGSGNMRLMYGANSALEINSGRRILCGPTLPADNASYGFSFGGSLARIISASGSAGILDIYSDRGTGNQGGVRSFKVGDTTAGAEMFGQVGGGWVWLTGPGGTTATTIRMTLDATGSLTLAGVASANGVKVGNAAIADANTLDWYQEGTFTPVVYGTSAAGTATYSVQSGRYTRIGNRVKATIHCVFSSHTGTGELRVSGLPFTSSGSASGNYGAALIHSGPTWTAGSPIAYVPPSSSFVRALCSASGATFVIVQMATAGDVAFDIEYEV